MPTMGTYCRAYPIKRLRQFKDWSENQANTRLEKQEIDGQEVEQNRILTDDDFLYLQENYLVTDGIFKDENILFNAVTSEWKDFCTQTLSFEIPNYKSAEPEAVTSTEEVNP